MQQPFLPSALVYTFLSTEEASPRFCTQITPVDAVKNFHFWETSWSSCSCPPTHPKCQSLALLASQQLLDLSHQPWEVAHVGVEVAQELQVRSRVRAVWDREGLAVPQKLQQGVFSMAAKDKCAKNKYFLIQTGFNLDFHFLSAIFNGCNSKV